LSKVHERRRERLGETHYQMTIHDGCRRKPQQQRARPLVGSGGRFRPITNAVSATSERRLSLSCSRVGGSSAHASKLRVDRHRSAMPPSNGGAVNQQSARSAS
jgi:hypothetical protein